jgi:ribosome-binding factor A
MASRRFSRKPPSPLCSDWRADDGLDPRFLNDQPNGKVSNRKALQLCRQVERALSGALEGDILRDLRVQSVHPAPDASRLLVVLAFHGPALISTAEVLAALERQKSKLRSEVAAAIHRRKTPELSFQLVR